MRDIRCYRPVNHIYIDVDGKPRPPDEERWRLAAFLGLEVFRLLQLEQHGAMLHFLGQRRSVAEPGRIG